MTGFGPHLIDAGCAARFRIVGFRENRWRTEQRKSLIKLQGNDLRSSLDSAMNTRRLAEIGIAIALAAVLSLLRVKLPHLLYGGSISLHMLPILMIAVRHGVRAGVLAGTAYGFVNLLLTPYIVHPIQMALDYPVAFGCLGIAALFGRAPLALWRLAAGVGAACALRLVAHVVSGFVYFSDLAPEGTPAWSYSLAYNSSYLIPETLLTLLVGLPLARRFAMRGGLATQPAAETFP